MIDESVVSQERKIAGYELNNVLQQTTGKAPQAEIDELIFHITYNIEAYFTLE